MTAGTALVSPGRRLEHLTATRNLKMARSAHAYVRGSTQKFYEWLSGCSTKEPVGPSIWICGDCHVGNLGPLADSKGRVAVQIRDLDQTVIGNPAHDLIRLGLSLASAARGSDLPGVTTARIFESLISGYEDALGGDFERVTDKSNRPRSVQALLKRSVRRRWRHLATERLEDTEPAIPLGRKFWPLAKDETAAIGELLSKETVRQAITGFHSRDQDDPIKLIDAAYWMKGCSSLGRLRYAAMVRVGKGKSSELCLVDIKEASLPAAPRASSAKMPRDNAERVVAGAKALSPNLGDRMVATRLLGKSVFIRELMPQDLKIEVEQLSPDDATALARYLAGVVGRAHGRQLDAPTRKAWRATLATRRTGPLDAPSWLWSTIVELIARHEAEYLEHCRRYSLAQAA